MLYPFSSQGMFPLASMPWVTIVDEWSFWEKTNLSETLWRYWVLRKIRMVFYFTTSFLAKTHNSFLSLLFNYKSLVFHPYQALQIHLPILYFLYSASGKNWAHTYWIALDITEAKRKKAHTWVLSLVLQFWPVLQARHICPLIIHEGNCKLSEAACTSCSRGGCACNS